MGKAKALTEAQTSRIAEYMTAREFAEGTAASLFDSWGLTYFRAAEVVRSGVTLRRGAEASGVSLGTFQKHVIADGFPTVNYAAWELATDADGRLPHHVIGRAIDAGQPVDVIRALLFAFSENVDAVDWNDDEVIAPLLREVLADLVTVAKPSNSDDSDNADEEDESGDSGEEGEEDEEPNTGEATTADALCLEAIRPLLALPGAIDGGDVPSLANLSGLFEAFKAASDAIKRIERAQSA